MDKHPMLERLASNRVLSVDPSINAPGWFELREQCDGNFYDLMTPVELLKLSNELMDLALNAIQPEG